MRKGIKITRGQKVSRLHCTREIRPHKTGLGEKEHAEVWPRQWLYIHLFNSNINDVPSLLLTSPFAAISDLRHRTEGNMRLKSSTLT